jgi:hypothetical protein
MEKLKWFSLVWLIPIAMMVLCFLRMRGQRVDDRSTYLMLPNPPVRSWTNGTPWEKSTRGVRGEEEDMSQ